MDEINLIEKGKNYGWPFVEGDKTQPGMQNPIRQSGAPIVWAPSGMAYLNDSLYFGGLRGQALYKVPFKDNNVIAVIEYLSGKFGRLRDVVVGPDGMLYVTTSNLDGRGAPTATDDKIIRINPAKL
jgi:glucose/arabinose dehydrogenase